MISSGLLPLVSGTKRLTNNMPAKLNDAKIKKSPEAPKRLIKMGPNFVTVLRRPLGGVVKNNLRLGWQEE